MNLSKAIVALSVLFLSCQSNQKEGFPSPTTSSTDIPEGWNPKLSKEVYYDKVLGMIIGSAIGDAMGAPTEMWSRSDIRVQYGYIDSLDVVRREPSPEGPWATNLGAGATTDDTRWKYLMTGFLEDVSYDSLDPVAFAKRIEEVFTLQEKELKSKKTYKEINDAFTEMTWLYEWAKVAEPYAKGDLNKYSYALNKFYGGEMSCAGMLYAPVVGAFYPGMPSKAYTEAFRLGIFDLGYARDITGLTAAYVSVAMRPGLLPSEIGLITRDVDPEHYFDSRLIGRIAFKIYSDAKSVVQESRHASLDSTDVAVPKNFKRSRLYFLQQEKAFSLLDKKLQDIPFHAGEIHLINLTAIEFSNGDFNKALEFVVNFGRDNDTVGAVTGGILGAYWGAEKLDKKMVRKVLAINRETLGIDLEKMALAIADKAYESH